MAVQNFDKPGALKSNIGELHSRPTEAYSTTAFIIKADEEGAS
jgi:hypothetical protein